MAEVRAALPIDRFQLGAFPAARAFLDGEFLVALEDRRVVAYLAYRRLLETECEILQLETAQRFRRRGLARALLQELKKQEPADLFLEVRRSNAAARYLYENQGFIRVGVRRNYYSLPDEDALVLKFHPC